MKKSAGIHKGFTLIELLIVIALLGALAVGLLATIDPFEQLKKGRDTSMRNTVSEFYNSLLRYYSIKSTFPWGTDVTANTVYAMSDQVAKLVSAGELKDKFFDLAGTASLDKIYVNATDGTHASVCFSPESKSFQNDPNTIYASDGVENTTTSGVTACKSKDVAGIDCYFCIQ